MTPIDWRRIAEPQVDGYDIQVTLDALKTGRYAEKEPRPVPDTALVWPEGRARFVRLSDNVCPSPELQDLSLDHPGVINGLAQLDKWPVVRPLCAQLLLGVSPLTFGLHGGGHGCTCGNFGDDWGWIYVTADSTWGFAEGIVHEMAHWKLRAFGVWFEDWTDLLLLNSPQQLYTSPVRKDMARPMGAVLHAQYSYIHVAAMCTAMFKATEHPTPADREWTALQLHRITEGQDTLRKHALGTKDAGELFLEGLDAWTTRVLEEGHAALAETT
jgi:hypothetical protein